MNTWRRLNPDWEYILWDNRKLERRKWRTQPQIDYYRKRRKWHGVADCMRYEILHEYGGIMPGADSECLRSITELFDNDNELFAVQSTAEKDWIGEDGRIPRFAKKESYGIAPIYGSMPDNEFVGHLVASLSAKDESALVQPWMATGNRFCTELLKIYKPEIKIFPMHYFIPKHFSGWKYTGEDKPYAFHHWGTTLRSYKNGR